MHLKYVDSHLVPEIVAKLPNETLESYDVEHSGGLDGFMSALYNIRLRTKTEKGELRERLLIAKFMKGDSAFRETSKSYVQFANEIYIYSQVLPAYQELLDKAGIKDISIKDWTAPCYVAKFGYVEGLSSSPSERECVLVLENLKPSGYVLGPRLYLSRDHLLIMCKTLGQYHALSYFLRISDPAKLERLRAGIVPLPFINDADPEDAKNNLYRVLYRAAFDRFFDFFDRKIDSNRSQNVDDVKLIERLRQLRLKYFNEPTRLLEEIRTDIENSDDDRRFGAILHGDYNRNNVLFKYKETNDGVIGGDALAEVEHMKMIDFQELRYGTPAIDLSFFLFFNTSESIRADVWLDLLKEYHRHMYDTLSRLVRANVTDEGELQKIEKQLEAYSFDNFNAHFKRYAFYGVMICMHFLPWILCSSEECEQLSKLFESDMHSEEFTRLSIEAGGDEVNMRLLEVMRHAHKMGYMDRIN